MKSSVAVVHMKTVLMPNVSCLFYTLQHYHAVYHIHPKMLDMNLMAYSNIEASSLKRTKPVLVTHYGCTQSCEIFGRLTWVEVSGFHSGVRDSALLDCDADWLIVAAFIFCIVQVLCRRVR